MHINLSIGKTIGNVITVVAEKSTCALLKLTADTKFQSIKGIQYECNPNVKRQYFEPNVGFFIGSFTNVY